MDLKRSKRTVGLAQVKSKQDFWPYLVPNTLQKEQKLEEYNNDSLNLDAPAFQFPKQITVAATVYIFSTATYLTLANALK